MSIGFSFLLSIDGIQIGHWVFALLRRFNLEHATRVLLATYNPALPAHCDRTIQVIVGIVTGSADHDRFLCHHAATHAAARRHPLRRPVAVTDIHQRVANIARQGLGECFGLHGACDGATVSPRRAWAAR